MTILYDEKASVYDNLDCLEDVVSRIDPEVDVEFDANDIEAAKKEVSRIDDIIESLVEKLDIVNDEHVNGDFTLRQTIDFFEETLPELIVELKKLRERLY